MTNEDTLQSSNDDRRVWIRFNCDVPTSCQTSHIREEARWPARIKDVSQGGMRLEVSRRFEKGTLLHIELPDPTIDEMISFFARVVHIEQLPLSKWSLGCQFARELSLEEVKALH